MFQMWVRVSACECVCVCIYMCVLGLLRHWQGQVFYSGFSFMTFETLKVLLADARGELTTPIRFGAGAVAGVLAQSGT
jgi:hypothetical protein